MEKSLAYLTGTGAIYRMQVFHKRYNRNIAQALANKIDLQARVEVKTRNHHYQQLINTTIPRFLCKIYT